MSQETVGFRVSAEVKQKVAELIEASGLNNREWFEQLVLMFEAQKMKDTAPEFEGGLKEMEIHTKRIFELFLGMVQQSQFFIQESRVKEEEAKKGYEEKKEKIVAELDELKEQSKEHKKIILELEREKSGWVKRQHDLETQVLNYQELLEGYKEKLNTYENQSSRITELEKLLQEEEKRRIEIASKHAEQKLQHETDIKERDQRFRQLENQIGVLQKQHELEIREGKIERDRAVLTVQQEHQKEIEKLRTEYEKKLDQLREENKKAEVRFLNESEENKNE